jgi:transposase
MSRSLTPSQVQQRLQEGRNYKRLYFELKIKFDALKLENQQLKAKLNERDDHIDGLKAEVKTLSEQVRKLADSKNRYRFYLFRQSKTQGKSKDKAHKPAQRNKTSYTRAKPKTSEITDTQELTLQACPGCHGPVSDSVETYAAYVEDIVFTPKSVTEYTVHRHWCTNCHKLVRPTIPNVLPGMQLGLNTVLFVLIEHYRAKKTDEQIVESLDRYFGLAVSSGEISEIRHKAAQYFQGRYHGIVSAIRTAIVIYADETGWFVRAKHGQCWHISAPEVPAVLYKIADTRAKDELQSILGEGFGGITVSDFYHAYDNVGSDQQKCWVHLLRESHLLARGSPASRERAYLHHQLTTIYYEIVKFRRVSWVASKAQKLEQQLDKRLACLAKRRWQDSGCQRLGKRICKYLKQLLTCVRIPGVLPENNTAERNLRPVVVQRKISHGNRSPKGARTYEINKSVIETFRLEGGDLIAKLKDSLWRAAWKQKLGVLR